MLGWMVYVLVVSALLAAAALAAEGYAHIRRRPARWLWGMAIIASLALPTAISSISVQAPRLTGALDSAAPQAAVPLRQLTSSALAPSAWLSAATGRMPASPDLDGLLTYGWIAASALLVAAILFNGAQLYRSKRRWATAVISGAEVYLSDEVGPAVVGLLRPRIVVPRWVLDAPEETQALIIAHERAHLDADDARLLAIAVLLIVCMPWNLPLWWQLRRLRFAIEVDCDARVLKAGGDLTRYGETLIMVGERHSANLAVVAAMSESRSFLEQRLHKMLSKQKKYALASAIGLGALSLVLAASAAEVSPPNKEPAGRQEIVVDAKTLDNYVGFYSVGDRAVLTVTRDGGQLKAQVTGQGVAPIFPSAKTEFFYKVVKAQLSFAVDGKGRATSVTLHQNGHDQPMPRIEETAARQINDSIARRVASQTASPGTEAALRRLVAGSMSGDIDYDQLEPALAKATREQQPRAKAFFEGLGPVQTISFAGVGPSGIDVYIVRHEHGVSRWMIALAPNGKVMTAAVTPGP
jgi:beta-lactamase regulating signal transducer with metallopeptidase domain